jgi:glucan phosphoethanolaminetransferase (alkaline phosphatase superfamily)
MDALTQIQFPLAVFWGVVFLALFLWFLWKHRIRLAVSFVVRHLAFILCVYFGVLWFLYEEQITTLIFGHVVYKHSPEEFPAGLVILGGVIFWFFIAILLLGKNRRVELGRYVEAFKFLRRYRK